MVSVWRQSTVRAIRKHRIRLLSYRSRGILMSYTDYSAQRRLKSTIVWIREKGRRCQGRRAEL